MTTVRLEKSALTGYASFETKGHSGYADEGEDIVCAAVSASTELIITVLEQFPVELKLKADRKSAGVTVEILQNDGNATKKDIIAKVLDGYAAYLKEVSAAYPAFVKVN